MTKNVQMTRLVSTHYVSHMISKMNNDSASVDFDVRLQVEEVKPRKSTARDTSLPHSRFAKQSGFATSIKISLPSRSSSSKYQKDRSQPRPMPTH